MLLSTLLSIAIAGNPQPPPIVNGSRTSDFIQVGAIMAYAEGQGGSPFCSGTLIHQRWVVTAAHCVEAVVEYDSYGYDILFLLGDNLYNNSGVVDYDTAVSWVMHPDYTGSQNSLGADIGLMELDIGFDNAQPIPLNQEVPSSEWEGSVLDYVGWGVTSDNRNDSGIKRHTQIPYVDSDSIFIYSYDSGTNLCSGDSGGAALRETEDGFVLVGVNSFVFSVEGSNPCVGGASGATRIDAYFDWIREYVPEPIPPVPEVSIEELEELVEDSDEKLVGCSTLDGVSPGWMLLSILALGIRREDRR